MFFAVTDLVAAEGEAVFLFAKQGSKLKAEQLPGPWDKVQDG